MIAKIAIIIASATLVYMIINFTRDYRRQH